MLKAILENPFRILGIYANATDKDIIAAADRLLSSPDIACDTDYRIDGLSKPCRDSKSVSSARLMLMDPEIAQICKLFWFMALPDKVGEDDLYSGNVVTACNEWFHLNTLESRHNIIVGNLVYGDYSNAAHYAYVALSESEYREKVLNTDLSFQQLIKEFKTRLFDESNAHLVPVESQLSWKQFVQNNILTGLSDSVSVYYLSKAKKQIDSTITKSYLEGLSTLLLSHSYLDTLNTFVDTSDKRYKRLLQDIVDNAQNWIEFYLHNSQDIFKYRNVKSYATLFSIYAIDKIQASYLKLLGYSFQMVSELTLLPQTCDVYNDLSYSIYEFYKNGDFSSKSFLNIIEKTAPGFVEVSQSERKESLCYQQLANFMARVGLLIIQKELSLPLTSQIVAYGGSVICYIDNVIDGKLLYDDVKKERDFCMNQLWNLGLGPVKDPKFPDAIKLMKWDSALYKDEETTYEHYCSSLRGCQSYLKRFPNGKYISEVNDLIKKNYFQTPKSVHTPYHTYSSTSKENDGPSPKPQSYPVADNDKNHEKSTYASTTDGKEITSVRVRSVVIYICITLLIELIFGLILGDSLTAYIVPLLMATLYWLWALKTNKIVPKISKTIISVFAILQAVASTVALIIIEQRIPAETNYSLHSLIHCSLLLGGSIILMILGIIINNYLDIHPGRSRPGNGESPAFLGMGNGVGSIMLGGFNRMPSNGMSVTVNYVFICFILPLFPVGCYNSGVTGFSRKSYKQKSITYSITGSQPWRMLEILQIYCKWYSYGGIILGIVGMIASLCGENFL